jgi:hypothetical protein
MTDTAGTTYNQALQSYQLIVFSHLRILICESRQPFSSLGLEGVIFSCLKKETQKRFFPRRMK